MTNKRLFAMVIGAFLIVLPLPSKAFAGNFMIGIVDMNAVLDKSVAADHAFNQIESKRKEYQEQLSRHEDRLRRTEKELLEERESLPEEVFAQKREAFQREIHSAERQVHEHRQILDRALEHSMRQLREHSTRIIADLAKEKQLGIVLNQDAVILAASSLDITEEVVKELNKRVKKIDIDWKKVGD